MQFLEKFMPYVLEMIKSEGNSFLINQKDWDKVYQKSMDPARDWLKDSQEDILKAYNSMLFQETWNKYLE